MASLLLAMNRPLRFKDVLATRTQVLTTQTAVHFTSSLYGITPLYVMYVSLVAKILRLKLQL